jgi:hypothetical protein
MPKSEFDKRLPVQDGRLKVSGVVGLDTDASGARTPGEEPVHVHWVLEQGGLVAHGRTESPGERFTDEAADAQPWEAGPARVTGVAVAVRQKPVAAIETFTWSQEVELTV